MSSVGRWRSMPASASNRLGRSLRRSVNSKPASVRVKAARCRLSRKSQLSLPRQLTLNGQLRPHSLSNQSSQLNQPSRHSQLRPHSLSSLFTSRNQNPSRHRRSSKHQSQHRNRNRNQHHSRSPNLHPPVSSKSASTGRTFSQLSTDNMRSPFACWPSRRYRSMSKTTRSSLDTAQERSLPGSIRLITLRHYPLP